MNDLSLLDTLVKRSEERTAAARQLQQIAREFHELIEDLLRLHKKPIQQVRVTRPDRRKTRGTAFERIARVFIDGGNEWVDTSELVKRSGVSRNVAATVMWSVHRDDFDQRPHSTHKRMKIWRLKTEAFDRLKQQRRLFEEPSNGKANNGQ